VVDSATGTPRSGAVVTIIATGQSARTNERGRFTLARVPNGDQSIRIQALGYRTLTRPLNVVANDTTSIDLSLGRDAVLLDTVRAAATSTERQAFLAAPNVGAVELSARAMAPVPRLGEADPIRVVQLLPGVQAKNDFSTGFNVRGGESDQNLILIDNIPIYNPFHLGGLFSTFIDPTVGDIKLLTGAFPSRYGGRLSSVLDVRSSEESRPGIHGSAELSVLATTATLSGALGQGKGSWLVAGRRTYADQAVRLVSDERVPYHFRDEQGHVVYELPRQVRLSVSLYDGRDILDGTFAEVADSSREGANGGAYYFSWGNLVGGVAISKAFGAPKLPLLGWGLGDSAIVEQRASTSRFSTLLDVGESSATYANRLSDSRLGGALRTYWARHDAAVGYDVSAFDINYATTSGQGSVDSHTERQRQMAAAVYYDDLWRLSPRLLVAAGARLESVTGRRWSALSPRISMKFLTSENSAFTLASGRFSQWTHSLTLEDNPIRILDLWKVSDSTTPVATAWQFVGGHERWFGPSRYARVEAFYKRYDRLLEYDVREDPKISGDEFIPTKGWSYGADLLLRQLEVGRFSGWLAYTYAMSMRRQDTVRFAPAHDRRHDLNVVGTLRIMKFVLGARLGYASGMPYTEIVGSIPRRQFDPVRSAWGSPGARVWYDDVGGPRNGARLPPTRRLDVYLERSFRKGGVSIAPYASVVNASNAKNVLFYIYDFSTAPATRRTISQFPVLPSAGVSVAF
jgi:hypothetical protein